MQIKLDMKILIFLLIFYITHQIKIYILLMIFAFLHELAHTLMGIILGIKPSIFAIKPVGFSITFFNKPSDYNFKVLNGNLLDVKNICVYLAGPLTNIVCTMILLFCKFNTQIRQELIYINLIIAFVNFLPMYPLDGGRIFKSLVSIFLGRKRGYKLTEKVSFFVLILVLGISSLVVLKVRNFGLVIMIAYLIYVKIVETKIINRKIKIYELIEKSKVE